MDLPVMPPVKPMLAKPVAAIPPGMHYEAKLWTAANPVHNFASGTGLRGVRQAHLHNERFAHPGGRRGDHREHVRSSPRGVIADQSQ
ncbi:hypothetical protein GCM10023080_093460 [Streptomyces pseudoechinosporeus]